jgi:hypothetical protein
MKFYHYRLFPVHFSSVFQVMLYFFDIMIFLLLLAVAAAVDVVARQLQYHPPPVFIVSAYLALTLVNVDTSPSLTTRTNDASDG